MNKSNGNQRQWLTNVCRGLGNNLPVLILLLLIMGAIASCNMPLTDQSIPPLVEVPLISSVAAGTGMLWYDGSILVYSSSSDSWSFTNPITYRQFSSCLDAAACTMLEGIGVALQDAELENSPLVEEEAALQYCDFVGASGVINSENGYRCEFKNPHLRPPSCELVDSTLEFTAAQPMTESAELQFDDFENDIKIKSSFCSNNVGGVTFDMPTLITDIEEFVITSDGKILDCSIVNGRLACTGLQPSLDATVEICASNAKITGGGPGSCPAGYILNADGSCIYSPVSKGLDLAGALTSTPASDTLTPLPDTSTPIPSCSQYLYYYDSALGKCVPTAFDPTLYEDACPDEGHVRNFLFECTPRCKEGWAPTKKFTVDSVPILSCYQCPAGTTSSGGVCYLCPEGTTSEVGGTCKPIIESSETPTAFVPTLTPVIDISETATPSATMPKATCNPWAASVMEHRPYDGTCSFSGKGTCMPGSLILYDEKTDITTCVTTSFYWISSCPSGYYLDDKTDACIAPSEKTGCFGYSLTESELSSCYPTGCLAGSSLDTDLQCCQSNPSDTDSNDSCVQFTVQVPACGDSPSGGNAGSDDEPPSPPSCSVEPNNPYCVP